MDKPKIAQKAPFVMDLEPGKYAWCSCGESSNQPYCDGSHKGTGFTPNIEEITEAKKVAWCGCKNSNNGSFCDGSHAKL
ncbi:CDGSH iron-sulfur domain-containing protein [Flavobacteriales bacterium]|jgi:CDGSH-type Zn-finger protein|nr:CDGSH iron-sulfur domain-containing protein [Flavobacteriales bacterium]